MTVIDAPIDCSGQDAGRSMRPPRCARPDELVAAPNIIGVSVADFNPDRDPDGTHGARVVEALESLWRVP